MGGEPAKEAAEALGACISRILSGAWRSSPPPLAATADEIAAVAPHLHLSGAGPLVHFRLRGTPLSAHAVAHPFRQAYRLAVLHEPSRDEEVAQAFAAVRAAGVEPILAKGWGVARLYTEPALRPYTDVDLAVPGEAYARVLDHLRNGAGYESLNVDLHAGFDRLLDRSLAALHSRSEVADAGGTEVRVLGREDHLRLLCTHLLGHGAWRPLWLCDVAVVVESAGRRLDWDLLREGSPRRTHWVTVALALARDLLGLDLSAAPPDMAAHELPPWALPAVRRQWGRIVATTPQGARVPMSAVRSPRVLLDALRVRWPDPIEATIGVGAAVDAWPRWPLQVAEYVRRSVRFAIRASP